jgi:hypothetical protein
MQTKAEIDAMFAAVRGEDPGYVPIARKVTWTPPGYELDVTLDFADLPHGEVSPKIAPIVAGLPEDVRSWIAKAKLAVFVRSRAGVLPEGNQIRLAGLAALWAAETHDGIILDLMTRRAWTPSAWRHELLGNVLSRKQVRLTSRPDGANHWLLSRGNPKYGAPDLQMRGIPAAKLDAARARFGEVEDVLLQRGGKPGAKIAVRGRLLQLQQCDAPPGLHDDACVQIPPP